jgi:tetratricopeptide (TPR) repeat protein
LRAIVGFTLGLTTSLMVSSFQPVAATETAQAPALRESSPKALQNLTQKQLARKDFRAARDTAQKLLSVDPASNLAKVWLAKALYGLKEYKASAQQYTSAIDAAPDAETKARLQYDRAQAEYFAQSYDEAIADFSALIAANPNEDLYLQRASAYDGLGKPDLAIQDLTAALKLHPDSHEVFLKRALLHKYMKKNDLALADFNEATKLNPALVTWRASFYRDQGQHSEAIQDFTTAISVNKGCGKAAELCNRALVYADLDHHRKAIDDLSDAIRLEPDRADFYANRGGSYFGVADFKHSISDFGEAIKRSPSTADYFFKRAEAEASDGQKQAAMKDYSEAIRLEPNKKDGAIFHYRRALVASDLNQRETALEDLSSAVVEDPTNADYWFDRGMEYHTMEKWKEAEADFSKAIELRPNFPTAYKHRALVRAKLDDTPAALEDLKASLQLYGDEKDMFGQAEVRRMIAKINKT